MKLIDILVAAGDETPLFGVHTKYLAMDPDGRVHGYCEIPSPTVLGWGIPDAPYSTDGRGCLIQIDRDDVDGQWQSAIITREQYESALAAKNDGWIDWGGGKHPPVSTNTVVDVKLEKGYVQSGYPAGEYSWEHIWQGSNIIAYRLHQPTKSEQVRTAAWNAYAGITRADDEADLNECIGQDAAPVWSGEGLPPVGEKVIFFINPRFDYATQGMPAEGREIEVVAHKKTSDGNDVAVCYWDENGGGRAVCLVPESLMPAKYEADRKRDEAVKAIMLTGWCQTAAEEIYDLIAAGKVPGMKLGD